MNILKILRKWMCEHRIHKWRRGLLWAQDSNCLLYRGWTCSHCGISLNLKEGKKPPFINSSRDEVLQKVIKKELWKGTIFDPDIIAANSKRDWSKIQYGKLKRPKGSKFKFNREIEKNGQPK